MVVLDHSDSMVGGIQDKDTGMDKDMGMDMLDTGMDKDMDGSRMERQ